MNISVVIICKNGSKRLAESILSVKGLGDEIMLYDSGSTDGSLDIARQYGLTIEQGSWEGYGRNRYKAALLAKNDWILMLDTDEVLSDELKRSILNIDLDNISLVYKFRYRNFFGNTEIKHGEWGNDAHIRMANRLMVQIDQEIVHEKLFLQPGLQIITLPGALNHYTVNDTPDYARKMMDYASLSAEKYLKQGKHSSFIKIFISPFFSFLQNYIFKRGFLDGWKGLVCASMTAWYTFLKYSMLRELENQFVFHRLKPTKQTARPMPGIKVATH